MKSFISWVGGKSRLADSIVTMIPPHSAYIEVFGGAAWVLFKKPQEISKCEVYNDINGDLVNLFRVVKYRPSDLIEALNLVLYSRETYHRFLKSFGEKIEDEVDRAARFFYIVKSSFGSKVVGGWGYGRESRARINIDADYFQRLAAQLQKVYIERQSFEKILKVWDSPGAFFYLDPPYWMNEKKLYQHEFSPDDHQRLRDLLGRLKGKWFLSYNDCPEVRGIYKGFKTTRTKQVHYCLNNKRDLPRKKNELFIANF